jgi:hypothetical protein
MLQQLLVALAVAVATLYMIWSFSPPARRQRWLDRLASRGLLVRAAARHRARLAAPGCGNCGSAGRHPLKRP